MPSTPQARNEGKIFLPAQQGAASRVAPEFVSSSFDDNSSLDSARSKEDERKWSVASNGSNPRRGFATLEIDTTDREPGGWKIKVSYYDERDFATIPYESRLYTLSERQFKFQEAGNG